MSRLRQLLDHQKRFVRDSAHQLRTPLAVLNAQVQSAQRGDVAAGQALGEISQTVDRATRLANQMLSLAKVEQLRQQPESVTLDLAEAVREVALDVSPLVADKSLDFELSTAPAPVPVRAHRWMLQELTRNLLHNAIKHSPQGAALVVRVEADAQYAILTVSDQGRGISDELRQRLFAPFAAGDVAAGSGLGLAICREIVLALGGRIVLDNRESGGRIVGLDALVHLPLARDNH
jgi:two-component system sensor histidine kinase TctE